MGVYLSRCLVRNKAKEKYRFGVLVDRSSSLIENDRTNNPCELDSFALLNQFLTIHPCSTDTFTIPIFMKYRILEDFVLFLQQRRIKLCTNYTNESVISP